MPVAGPAYLTTPVERPMKVVDLVTHTSGLTYGFLNRTAVDDAYRRAHVADFNAEGGLDAMIEQLAGLPLEFSPGTAWNYSVSIDVLGYLVQQLSGMRFSEFLRTRLFEPLGMTDTAFWCPPEKLGRLAHNTRRSRSYLAAEAVESYVDRELEIIEGIQRGLSPQTT